MDESPAESRLSAILIAFTAWVARHPWLAIGFCLVTLGLSLQLARTQLTYRTQRDDLMSADKECQVRWRHYLSEFGSDDDIVFIVEGANRPRIEAALDDIASRLRTETALFDRVFDRVDLTHLSDRSLLYLSTEELRQLDEHLQAFAPLLGPNADAAWSGVTLETLTARLRLALATNDRAFIEQYRAILVALRHSLDNPTAMVNPWQPAGRQAGELLSTRRFFSTDGSLGFLLARPVHLDQQSFTPAAAAVLKARQLLTNIKQGYPDLSFGITGLPVLEHDEMAGTDRDSMNAAWIALAGMSLLFFVVYRGLRYPLLTVASLLAGTVWALGLTTVTIGHLNILSSAFAVMLIGMGDYGVLWIARFDEERQAGCGLHESLRRTANHAGPSIVTAALTTSLAFFAIMLADFQAVAELGFIAGSGVLLCALACFILMPALLVLTQRRPSPGVLPFTPRPKPWLPWVARNPRGVAAFGGVLLVVGGYLALSLRYDPNLLHLQSQKLDSVRWELKLLERSPGSGWHAISIAKSPEEAVLRRKQYEALPEVARVEEIASLIPPEQDLKHPLVARIAQRLRHLPPREAAMRNGPVDADALNHEWLALAMSPNAESLRGPLLAILDAADQMTVQQLQWFEQRMRLQLWEMLNQLKSISGPGAITLNDVPANLRERFVSPSGLWLVRAYAKDNLWEPPALAHFVEQARTVDPAATGKPFGTLEGLNSMKSGYFHAGIYALLAIVLILSFDFRSGRYLLLALLPLTVGMVMALGILRLVGASLNPANLVALPLIVGVGVDNGVHVLHDFRTRQRGRFYLMTRATGRGILVAALTTIIGFASLMVSRHEGMFDLGLILSLGVACCMLTSLILLPAVLGLLDLTRQTLRQRQEVRRAA